MTTDDDIVRVLNGEPDAEQQRSHNAILEALGHEPKPIPGLLPLARRGDDFEETSIWAAKEAASRAIKELSEAIMRQDGSKNIYAAEHEAKAIAAEAYEFAGQSSPYEDDRHRAIERYVGKLAVRIQDNGPKPGVTTITKP